MADMRTVKPFYAGSAFFTALVTGVLGTFANYEDSIEVIKKLNARFTKAQTKEDLFYELITDCREPLLSFQDEDKLDTLHVAYSTDSPNFVGLFHSMMSLTLHLREAHNCYLHILVAEEDMQQAIDLIHCFKHELSILPVLPVVVLHKLRPLPFNLSTLQQHDIRTDLRKPQTFARLYLHEYLPTVRRVIWLDHDTIVQFDLGSLYRMKMHHNIAATWEWGNGTFAPYRKIVPGRVRPRIPHGSKRIFNSGVLVIDLDRWRSGGFTEALAGAWPLFAGINGDQLLMNLVFKDFDRLSWQWNFMGFFIPLEIPRHCINGARILHWTWNNKPWHSDRLPELKNYDYLWERYGPSHVCGALPQLGRGQVARRGNSARVARQSRSPDRLPPSSADILNQQ